MDVTPFRPILWPVPPPSSTILHFKERKVTDLPLKIHVVGISEKLNSKWTVDILGDFLHFLCIDLLKYRCVVVKKEKACSSLVQFEQI